MRKNNKIVVIISIVVTLALIGGIVTYLFIATDVFKSNKELFSKYFMQEVQCIQNVTDLETVETYETLRSIDKFETNTNFKVIHSEGGEVSNPLNNLSAKLDIQKDAEQQYLYGNAQILYGDEKYFEAQIIKDEESYGVGFPDVFRQFLTIERDENIESIANDLGIDVAQLETIMNIIDGKQSILSQEQENTIRNKYSNIINILLNGTFEKQKNAMITYNNVTTKTNAYSVLLTSEQVKNILLEITDEVDETLEVPSAKITVYEQKKVAIRTVIEIEQYKIIIENISQNGELKTKINYTHLSDEQTLGIEAELIKTSIEDEEVFEISANVTEGEQSYLLSLSNNMKLTESTVETDFEISMVQDITTISLVLENVVKKGNDFEKLESVTKENSRSLNSIQNQAQRKALIETLKEMISQKVTEKTFELMMKTMIIDGTTENATTQPEISQLEINNFNAKFEFYTGEEISSDNVKMLLNIVKNHLASYEITENEHQQDTGSVLPEENKINIKLTVEKDKINEEGVNKVLEKISDSAKYKISLSYKQSNGMVDYITITEI